MAINLDNTTMTLDFGYTDDNVNYKIRFHNTEELGDTISLSEDGSDYLSYPAIMIMDIGAFLKEQKLIKASKTEKDTKDTKDTKKTKEIDQPIKKISNLLNNDTSIDEEGVSNFGGLSVPKIEGEIDILSNDQQDDFDDDPVEENVMIKKFAENIEEELVEPNIQETSELTKADVEKEWMMRKNKPKPEDGKPSVKRS